MPMNMKFGVPLMMGSQWEYEPSNILIYEKEFHHYVVYYVAQGDSRVFLSGLQHASSTGNAKDTSNSVAVKLFVSFFFFFF
jgi:hypothetical protein